MIENPPREKRIFQVNGKRISLPSDQGDRFLETYPEAEERVAFVVGSDTLTVPVGQAEAFQAKYKDAKDLFASKEPVKKKGEVGFQTAQDAITPATPLVTTQYDPAPEYKFPEGKDLYVAHKELAKGVVDPLSPEEFHTMHSNMPEVDESYTGESVFKGSVPWIAIKALDFLNTQDKNIPPNMYHKTAEDVVHTAMVSKLSEEVIKDVNALEEEYQNVAESLGGADQGVSQIGDPYFREKEIEKRAREVQEIQARIESPTALTKAGDMEKIKKLQMESKIIHAYNEPYAVSYSAAADRIINDPKYKSLTYDEQNALTSHTMMDLYNKSIMSSNGYKEALDGIMQKKNIVTPQEAVSRLETANLRYGDPFKAIQNTPQIDRIDEDGRPVFNEEYIKQLQEVESQAYSIQSEKTPIPTQVSNCAEYIIGNGLANGTIGQVASLIKGQPISDTYGYEPNMAETILSDVVALASDLWLFELGGKPGSLAARSLSKARLGKVLGVSKDMALKSGMKKGAVDMTMKAIINSNKYVGIGASATSFATYEGVNESLKYFRANGGNFDLADFSADVTKSMAFGLLTGTGMGYISHFAKLGKGAMQRMMENRLLKSTLKADNTIANKVLTDNLSKEAGTALREQMDKSLAKKSSRLNTVKGISNVTLSGSEWVANSGLLTLSKPMFELVTEGKELDVDNLGQSFVHNMILVGLLHGKQKGKEAIGLRNRAINDIMYEKSKKALYSILEDKKIAESSKITFRDQLRKMKELKLNENRGNIDLTPQETAMLKEVTGGEYSKITHDKVADVLADPGIPFVLKQKVLMDKYGVHITDENIHFAAEVNKVDNSVDLYDVNGVLLDKVYDNIWINDYGVKETTKLDTPRKLNQVRDIYSESANTLRMEWLSANIDTPAFNLSLPIEDRAYYVGMNSTYRNRVKNGENLSEVEMADREFIYKTEGNMDKFTKEITKHLSEANKAFELQNKEREAAEDKAKKAEEKIQRKKNEEETREKQKESRKEVKEEPVEKIQKPISGKVSKFKVGDRIIYEGEEYLIKDNKDGEKVIANKNRTVTLNPKLEKLIRSVGAKKGIPTFREGESLNYKGEDFTVHVDEGNKITLENDNKIIEVNESNKGDISRNAKTEFVSEINEGDSIKYKGKTYRVEKNKRGDMMLESKSKSVKLTDEIRDEIKREYDIAEEKKVLDEEAKTIKPETPEEVKKAKEHVEKSDARDKDIADEITGGPEDVLLKDTTFNTLDKLDSNEAIGISERVRAELDIIAAMKRLEDRKSIPAEAEYLDTYESWGNYLYNELNKLKEYGKQEKESKRKDNLKDIDASKRKTEGANKKEEYTDEQTELKSTSKPKKEYKDEYISATDTRSVKGVNDSATWRNEIKSINTIEDLHDYVLDGTKVHPSQKAAFLKAVTDKYSTLRTELPVKEREMMFKKAKNLPQYKVVGKILDGLDIANRVDILKRLQRGNTKGFVNLKSGEIGLNGKDVETLAHELGHKTDLTNAAVENFLKNENLEALHELAKFGVGSTTTKGDPYKYEYMENYAEFIKEYLLDPKATYKKAPYLVDMLPPEMLKKMNSVTGYFQLLRDQQAKQDTNVMTPDEFEESMDRGGIEAIIRKANIPHFQKQYSRYMELLVNTEYDLERRFAEMQNLLTASDEVKKIDYDMFLALKRLAKSGDVYARNQLEKGLVLPKGDSFEMMKDSKGNPLTLSSWTNDLDAAVDDYRKISSEARAMSRVRAGDMMKKKASNVMVAEDIVFSATERLPYMKTKEVLQESFEISKKNAKIQAENKKNNTNRKEVEQVGIPEEVWRKAVKLNSRLPWMEISEGKTYGDQYKEATGEAKDADFDFTKDNYTGIKEYRDGGKFETDYEAALDIIEEFNNFDRIYNDPTGKVSGAIKDAMKDYRALNWFGIEFLKDAEVIGDDLYYEFEMAKDFYVPLQRMMIEAFDKVGANIKDDASSYSDNVRMLKENIFHARNKDGSTRDLKPLDLSTMANLETMMRMGLNNKARNSWHKLFQGINEQGGKQFNNNLYERELTKSEYDNLETKHKGEVINYLDNGKMKYYKVAPEIADAFNMTMKKPLTSEAAAMWQQALSFSREMITGTAGFAIGNMIRDFGSLIQYTKGGDIFVNFGKDAYYNTFGKDKKGDRMGSKEASKLFNSVAQQFSQGGAKFRVAHTNKVEKILRDQNRFVRKLRRDNALYKSTGGKLLDRVGKAASIYRQVKKLNEAAEGFARKIEFKNVYNRKLSEGYTPKEALYEAAFRSIDLMDFGRGGRFTKQMNNNLFVFLNAKVQGANKMVRTFREGTNADKAQQVARMMYGQVLPDMMLRTLTYNMADDEEKKLLNAAAPRLQLMYYMIPYKDQLGITSFMRIPKAFDIGAVGSVISSIMLNSMREKDEKIQFHGTLKSLASTIPLTSFLSGESFGGIGLMGAVVEVALNKNLFTEKTIDPTVKFGDGGFPNLAQSRKSSSWIGKGISDGLVKAGLSGLGITPKLADYFFTKITGRYGEMGVEILKEVENWTKGTASKQSTEQMIKNIVYKRRFSGVFSPYSDVNYLKMAAVSEYNPNEGRSKSNAKSAISAMNLPWRDADNIKSLINKMYTLESDYTDAYGDDVLRFNTGIKLIDVSRKLNVYDEKYGILEGIKKYDEKLKRKKLQ